MGNAKWWLRFGFIISWKKANSGSCTDAWRTPSVVSFLCRNRHTASCISVPADKHRGGSLLNESTKQRCQSWVNASSALQNQQEQVSSCIVWLHFWPQSARINNRCAKKYIYWDVNELNAATNLQNEICLESCFEQWGLWSSFVLDWLLIRVGMSPICWWENFIIKRWDSFWSRLAAGWNCRWLHEKLIRLLMSSYEHNRLPVWINTYQRWCGDELKWHL